MLQDGRFQQVISLAALLLLFSGVIFTTTTKAQEDKEKKCFAQYGEEIECPTLNKAFTIKKKVLIDGKPKEQRRGVEPGSKVKFLVTVSNPGELESDLRVIDELPKNLDIQNITNQDGEAISFKREQNRVQWEIKGLKPDQTRTFVLITKANGKDIEPGTEKCVNNQVVLNRQQEFEGADTAAVCVKKGEVLGEKEAPEKLPETGLLNVSDNQVLGLAVVLLLTGLITRNSSRIIASYKNS